jgi:phage tail sheath protein FI
MPPKFTYPGVYINEIPSGVHTITGAATSITAFIGRAARGPVNEATLINSYADYGRIFGGLSLISSMSYAVRDFFLNGGNQAIIVRLANGASAATITLPEDTTTPPPLLSNFTSLLLHAASLGKWGATLSATVDHNTDDPTDSTLFNLTVQLFDATGQQLLASEKYLNLSVNPSDMQYVPKVLAQNSQLVVVPEDNTQNYKVPGVRPADTTTIFGSPPQTVPGAVPAQGGNDGSALTDNNFIGPGMQENKQGLYALETADLFNILCIPPYNGDDITTAVDVSTSVVAAAATYCELKRAFYLVDSPSCWNTKSIVASQFSDPNTDYLGTRSDHAALFFPRINEANPLHDGVIETFVPCGAVAGVFARTDATHGVWKAAAGQDATLIGIVQLAVSLTDAESSELNALGVNCLRSFPVIGQVIWGERTLQGADRLGSEWKYIPVRRTALFLEESLYRGTKWVLFEPNDEELWAQIRLNVGAFMETLFQQGALQGATLKEAYFVKCDSETTTQNDVDLGIVNIVVGFAPLKPAEFVVIRIQQMAGKIECQ